MPSPPAPTLLALRGRVVTMDPSSTVIQDGVVYIRGNVIVAVQPFSAPEPTGFDQTSIVDSGGTIFPGLIELHNHLSYNILKLWDVPKAYKNRGQWAGIPEYQQLISGPMKRIGQAPGLMASLVRYVECKCLFGGTTTSQGIALYSNMGARRFYRGIVRNVEQTGDPDLPEAGTRIPDVDAKDARSFLARLAQKKCYLLHLSEGVDDSARKHFTSLEFEPGKWAIADSLAGIHCVALKPQDYDVLADHGASMIWSPLSNLLLYGGTADVAAAKNSKVRMGLGSDWSPSGSKNLLGELKAAHLVSQQKGGLFSDEELVAMATCNAAAILRWDQRLGSIEKGKCADVFVIEGHPRDAYHGLIKATEKSVRLVMINGVARYGEPEVMASLGSSKVEALKVGGEKRNLYLEQETEDPDVSAVAFGKAASNLA